MDILALQQRLTDFMLNPASFGGQMGPSQEAEALRKELAAAIEANVDIPGLRELADALDMMKAVATDPDVAKTMAEQAMKDYEPNPEIFDAIDDGDVDAVNAALADWEINATHGEFNKTALYHAMANMFGVSLPVVTLLLDTGADAKLGLGETSNVLHGLGFGRFEDIAAEDLAEIVNRCVALGADLEQRSNELGWTPLITAASEWNPIATEALLLAGADIDARAGDVPGVCFAGETALAFAGGHEATRSVLERFLTAT